MQNNTWGQAFAELVGTVAKAFTRFLKQDMVQVGLTVGMFLALAVPLLLVLLLLWYLDYTGWRPSRGFYTIGMSQQSLVFDGRLFAAELTVSGREASLILRSIPHDAVTLSIAVS